MDTNDQNSNFFAEISSHFGLVPNIFRPLPHLQDISQDLWLFAKFAYLENGLPTLFKERLFVYLSRYCSVHYPLVRHAGFLIGLGRPAGNPTANPLTIDSLRLLIIEALPDSDMLREAVRRLRSLPKTSDLPAVGTIAELDLFHAITIFFLEPTCCDGVREALQSAFGIAFYQQLNLFLAYVRTEHFWAEAHPDVTIEPDLKALLESDKELASVLLSPAVLYGTRARRKLGAILVEMDAPAENPDPKKMQNELVGTTLPDFTRINNSEKKLLQTEERFKVLIDVIPQVIWTNDGEGRANYFNKRWFDFSGLTFNESAGMGWQAIVHPEDAVASINRWREAMQNNKEFETEYRLRRADGEYRWFIGRNVPLLDTENQVLGWFGTATDIEDLKIAEGSLRESREKLRITVESASDYVIITLDVNGNIVSWSKGAEFAFGYTEEEVQGKYVGIIFTPSDRETGAPDKEINDAAVNGRAIDERWHMRKDGSKFYMSGVMAPITADTGLQGFVKVARDMTERKLIEQLKDEFIGIASHELKTPVTNIKGYVQILHAKLSDIAEGEDAMIVQRLNNQVGRLTSLIGNLLDTTKISEGKLDLYPEFFQLDDLIRERVEELQALAPNHQLYFRAGIKEPIRADKERIGQVLTNLLSNAIKYSPAGGAVKIETEDLGQVVRVRVSDTGVGIPAAVKEKVFDRFFRVNSPQTQTLQGMGLGLYISAGIVQRHNGSISVQSGEGTGSVFTVILPHA